MSKRGKVLSPHRVSRQAHGGGSFGAHSPRCPQSFAQSRGVRTSPCFRPENADRCSNAAPLAAEPNDEAITPPPKTPRLRPEPDNAADADLDPQSIACDPVEPRSPRRQAVLHHDLVALDSVPRRRKESASNCAEQARRHPQDEKPAEGRPDDQANSPPTPREPDEPHGGRDERRNHKRCAEQEARVGSQRRTVGSPCKPHVMWRIVLDEHTEVPCRASSPRLRREDDSMRSVESGEGIAGALPQ